MTDRSRILQAVDALRAFDRQTAVALIREELEKGSHEGQQWKSISMLASQIGEIDMALEASRRFAATKPRTLGSVLGYCSDLAVVGRHEGALREVSKLPQETQNSPPVLHFTGTIATQLGQFDKATAHFRKALSIEPLVPQTWFALSMIKKFKSGDATLAKMEDLRKHISQAEPNVQANFLYALGKAYHDIGEFDQAFETFSEGATLQKTVEKVGAEGRDVFANTVIETFTADAINKNLIPSKCDSDRSIFVTGIPRSGTTLVEQILSSHSAVIDGGELNLFRAALIPTGDYSFDGALAYQKRAPDENDPWGAIGRNYLELLNQRFGKSGRVVDKTLNHSRFMGLILHAMPNARVIWMRRNPEDVAISCFRNYFASAVPWSWSLIDIANYFRMEDKLYAHWTKEFPDRILTVQYEELVSDPRPIIQKILNHTGLEKEEGVFTPQKSARKVLTASVAQVREPISSAQVNASNAYHRHLRPFREIYNA